MHKPQIANRKSASASARESAQERHCKKGGVCSNERGVPHANCTTYNMRRQHEAQDAERRARSSTCKVQGAKLERKTHLACQQNNASSPLCHLSEASPRTISDLMSGGIERHSKESQTKNTTEFQYSNLRAIEGSRTCTHDETYCTLRSYGVGANA